MTQLYHDSGRKGELTMLLQHGLLQESVTLAKIILKNSNNDSYFFQLGIDILKRLHEDEEVIFELQSRKHVSYYHIDKSTQSHGNVPSSSLNHFVMPHNLIAFISFPPPRSSRIHIALGTKRSFSMCTNGSRNWVSFRSVLINRDLLMGI